MWKWYSKIFSFFLVLLVPLVVDGFTDKTMTQRRGQLDGRSAKLVDMARRTHEPVPPATDRVASLVVDSAIAVHRALGPGLLESVYETCMAHELGTRGVNVQRQVHLPIVYGGVRVDGGLRLDLLVDERVIVELKAVDAIEAIHTAQMLTYLKLSGLRLGILMNFNVIMMKDGIHRIVL